MFVRVGVARPYTKHAALRCCWSLFVCTGAVQCRPSTLSMQRCAVVGPCLCVQVLSNAGQANAATGDQGYEDAVNCATLAAASLGVSPDDVLLMSTGAQPQPQQQRWRWRGSQQHRTLL
jgi:N-acetylglutamate synthase/N-acetylornithine aminotransferase